MRLLPKDAPGREEVRFCQYLSRAAAGYARSCAARSAGFTEITHSNDGIDGRRPRAPRTAPRDPFLFRGYAGVVTAIGVLGMICLCCGAAKDVPRRPPN